MENEILEQLENLAKEESNETNTATNNITQTETTANIVVEELEGQTTEANTRTLFENANEVKQGPKKESIETVEKVENRGRHKKDCDCEKCKAKKKPESKPENKGESLEQTLSKYKEEKPNANAPAPARMIDASKFVSGALFLVVMDAVFPMLIIYVGSMFNEKLAHIKDSSRKKLKLDADEKKMLEPLADEIVKYMFGDSDPRVIFFVALGSIYYSKIDSLSDEDFKRSK